MKCLILSIYIADGWENPAKRVLAGSLILDAMTRILVDSEHFSLYLRELSAHHSRQLVQVSQRYLHSLLALIKVHLEKTEHD